MGYTLYDEFVSTRPLLTRSLLDTNHDVARLCLAVCDTVVFLYGRHHDVPPAAIHLGPVTLTSDGILRIPLSHTPTATAFMRPQRQLGEDFSMTDWQMQLNDERVAAVRANPAILDAMEQVALHIATFADRNRYAYTSVTIAPNEPPFLTPDGVMVLPLRVAGTLRDPAPMPETEEVLT